MSGPIRSFSQGEIYHVYNRGNHRDMIFRDNPDRVLFLSKLDEYADLYRVGILTYCLMDNHFHVILQQASTHPIGKMMHALATSYVKAHNQKYGLVGRLFQGPYKAKLIPDEGALAWVSRYIHLNPRTDYATYRWSSYRQFAGRANGICDVGPVLDCFGGSRLSYDIFIRKGLKPGLAAAPATLRRAARPLIPGARVHQNPR